MSLLSFEFLALAVLTALLLCTRRGPIAAVVFLGVNAWFASSYLNRVDFAATWLFLGLGYLLARLVRGRPRWVAVAGVAALVATFVCMRGYSFLDGVLPRSLVRETLAYAGLSFLLFKMIHVLVDSAGGSLPGIRLSTYLNYCLNFTTFLMGPIQRYQDFESQWERRQQAIAETFEAHLDALNRILRGLVKKFVLAEALHQYTLYAGNLEAASALELLGRTYAFYFFLYLDFSGYCDVMIGCGSLMGIRPPENFRLPFLSRNVGEFWLRVHRSLTLWLTDYVFNPCYSWTLRRRSLRQRAFSALALAMLLTMLVSGLWHGTTLSFLCFGLAHGVLLIASRGYERLMVRALGRQGFHAFARKPLVHAAAVLLTFQLTSMAYVFFVLDFGEVQTYVGRLVGA